MIFCAAHRFHALRKSAIADSVRIADSPGCSVPKAVRSTLPGVRLSSSKLQPFMSCGASPTLVNSTNSPPLPALEYMNSVILTSAAACAALTAMRQAAAAAIRQIENIVRLPRKPAGRGRPRSLDSADDSAVTAQVNS